MNNSTNYIVIVSINCDINHRLNRNIQIEVPKTASFKELFQLISEITNVSPSDEHITKHDEITNSTDYVNCDAKLADVYGNDEFLNINIDVNCDVQPPKYLTDESVKKWCKKRRMNKELKMETRSEKVL